MLRTLHAFAIQVILLAVFSFILSVTDKIAIAKGKLSPDDSSLSEPERMLLEKYTVDLIQPPN